MKYPEPCPENHLAMDYDKSDIASIYDEARAITPEGLGQWLDLLSTHLERNTISLIIDLGCGTGRFSEPLAARFGVRVIATDPSQTMLDQARRKGATGTWFCSARRHRCCHSRTAVRT